MGVREKMQQSPTSLGCFPVLGPYRSVINVVMK